MKICRLIIMLIILSSVSFHAIKDVVAKEKPITIQMPKDKNTYFCFYGIHDIYIVFHPYSTFSIINAGHFGSLLMDSGSWVQNKKGKMTLKLENETKDYYLIPIRYKTFTFLVWEKALWSDNYTLSEIKKEIDLENRVPSGIYSYVDMDSVYRMKSIKSFIIIFPILVVVILFLRKYIQERIKKNDLFSLKISYFVTFLGIVIFSSYFLFSIHGIFGRIPNYFLSPYLIMNGIIGIIVYGISKYICLKVIKKSCCNPKSTSNN
jgi:hypothetical protein